MDGSRVVNLVKSKIHNEGTASPEMDFFRDPEMIASSRGVFAYGGDGAGGGGAGGGDGGRTRR